MAYSSPASRSTGDVIGATQWNELVTDIKYLAELGSSGRPFCLAYRSTNQSISNSTLTSVTWNAETTDNAAAHSTSVNTSRLSAPVDGWYKAWPQVVWAANSTGVRNVNVLFNGTGQQVGMDQRNATSSFETAGTAPWSGSMTAGQYIEIAGYQNSGGALNVLGSATSPRSWVLFEWVAPL
jgi:hypothetical protein